MEDKKELTFTEGIFFMFFVFFLFLTIRFIVTCNEEVTNTG